MPDTLGSAGEAAFGIALLLKSVFSG